MLASDSHSCPVPGHQAETEMAVLSAETNHIPIVITWGKCLSAKKGLAVKQNSFILALTVPQVKFYYKTKGLCSLSLSTYQRPYIKFSNYLFQHHTSIVMSHDSQFIQHANPSEQTQGTIRSTLSDGT